MKTIYQPTEEELKEMGFTIEEYWRNIEGSNVWGRFVGVFSLVFLNNGYFYLGKEKIYPTSKQQVLDLISLFTPVGTKQ